MDRAERYPTIILRSGHGDPPWLPGRAGCQSLSGAGPGGYLGTGVDIKLAGDVRDVPGHRRRGDDQHAGQPVGAARLGGWM